MAIKYSSTHDQVDQSNNCVLIWDSNHHSITLIFMANTTVLSFSILTPSTIWFLRPYMNQYLLHANTALLWHSSCNEYTYIIVLSDHCSHISRVSGQCQYQLSFVRANEPFVLNLEWQVSIMLSRYSHLNIVIFVRTCFSACITLLLTILDTTITQTRSLTIPLNLLCCMHCAGQ